MVRSIDTGLPSVLRGRVVVRRTALALDTVEVLAVCATRNGVVIPEETSGSRSSMISTKVPGLTAYAWRYSCQL